MGMCYAWTTSVNSAKLLKPSLPWGGNMGRRLLLLHFISRVRAIVYRNLVVLPMAQNFIESIRDCLDHISQRRRDNGWGGCTSRSWHLEAKATNSQMDSAGLGGNLSVAMRLSNRGWSAWRCISTRTTSQVRRSAAAAARKWAFWMSVERSVFFKYFAMISNFRVPCNTRHADTLELMRAHSIPLKRSGCELHAHVRGDANLAMGVHPWHFVLCPQNLRSVTFWSFWNLLATERK